MEAAADHLEDLIFPDMLYGITIRSPVPAGKILEIKAPKMGRNYTLITAQDIPGKKLLDGVASKIPILAGEEASYIG
ncbi:MAG: xanthine dehydrogenase family protein molybdopterin-binding subunit, partial [Termitinemataceae bacterium]